MLGKNFWLLVAATVVAGYYSANGQLYRFAAAELATPEYRERAVSMVLAGGIIGGGVFGLTWRNIFVGETDAEVERLALPAFETQQAFREAMRKKVYAEQGRC